VLRRPVGSGQIGVDVDVAQTADRGRDVLRGPRREPQQGLELGPLAPLRQRPLFGSALVPPRARRRHRRGVQAALLTLPEDDVRALRFAAPFAPTALGGDAQFVYGLELIVDGIEAQAVVAFRA
jgi:hypothetical protein